MSILSHWLIVYENNIQLIITLNDSATNLYRRIKLSVIKRWF